MARFLSGNKRNKNGWYKMTQFYTTFILFGSIKLEFAFIGPVKL